MYCIHQSNILHFLSKLSMMHVPYLDNDLLANFFDEINPSLKKATSRMIRDVASELDGLVGVKSFLSPMENVVEPGLPMNLWKPDFDMVKKPNSYEVSVDLPGMKKQDVKVTIATRNDGQYLCISGERKQESSETHALSYLRQVRKYGSFAREFLLPDDSLDAIKASMADGVLTVIIPRTKPVDSTKNEKIKNISIQ